MLRANLPLWYTEGYNPHPRITIALPLSVGCESECELLDVRVTELPDFAQTAKTGVMLPCLSSRYSEIYEPIAKFSDIGFAEYKIYFDLPYSDDYPALFSGPGNSSKAHKKRRCRH